MSFPPPHRAPSYGGSPRQQHPSVVEEHHHHHHHHHHFLPTRETLSDTLYDTVDGCLSLLGDMVDDCVSLLRFCLQPLLGITVVLYILNQKHLLPLPVSRVVSKALFWPTLPLTVGRRYLLKNGDWTTKIDDTVVMGGAPFGFVKWPERLHEQYNVHGVINMCEEYEGPLRQYQSLGVTELRLPTPDHFEVTLSHLKRAVHFVQMHQARGQRVYVHCRAGHGRSAAVVFAWLLAQDAAETTSDINSEGEKTTTTTMSKDAAIQRMHELNQQFCQVRHVRKSLWKQPNLRRYYREQLLQQQKPMNKAPHGPLSPSPETTLSSSLSSECPPEEKEEEESGLMGKRNNKEHEKQE